MRSNFGRRKKARIDRAGVGGRSRLEELLGGVGEGEAGVRTESIQPSAEFGGTLTPHRNPRNR
jgi:hypothetical protein